MLGHTTVYATLKRFCLSVGSTCLGSLLSKFIHANDLFRQFAPRISSLK